MKSRGMIIAGNWKMNHTQKDTDVFFAHLKTLAHTHLTETDQKLLQGGQLQACVIPSTLALERAQTGARQLPFPLSIATQNAHGEAKGAYTGEISGPCLKEIGVQWALLGHSERRQYFGETDRGIRARAEGLLKQGFQVMICIGEKLEERKSGETFKVLKAQLDGILAGAGGITPFLNGKVSFAYEPVWAIGTGLTASPQEAEAVHQQIREWLSTYGGATQAAEMTPLLYGGSVTPQNAEALLSCPNIDGALVGGASLKPESFLELLRSGGKTLLA